MKVLRISTLCVICVFFLSCGYNTMQQNEEAVLKAWGDVESNLQRRADLIPNLVEVVKGYAAQEKETLTAVIEARAKATAVNISASDLSSAQAMQRLSGAQGALSSALSRLIRRSKGRNRKRTGWKRYRKQSATRLAVGVCRVAAFPSGPMSMARFDPAVIRKIGFHRN